MERALEGEGKRYTLAEIAERAEVPVEYLARQRQAVGLSVEDSEEAVATEDDLEAARRIRVLLDAGLPEEGLLEVSRVIGIAMSQLAAANRALIADAMVREGDTEYDVAMRLAAAAKSRRAATTCSQPFHNSAGSARGGSWPGSQMSADGAIAVLTQTCQRCPHGGLPDPFTS